MSTVYRYQFPERVPMEEVETTLLLALLSTTCLHGETRTRLDVSHVLDPVARSCDVDASNRAAAHFNSLFAGFLRREFGEDGFRVERVGPAARAPRPPVRPEKRR